MAKPPPTLDRATAELPTPGAPAPPCVLVCANCCALARASLRLGCCCGCTGARCGCASAFCGVGARAGATLRAEGCCVLETGIVLVVLPRCSGAAGLAAAPRAFVYRAAPLLPLLARCCRHHATAPTSPRPTTTRIPTVVRRLLRKPSPDPSGSAGGGGGGSGGSGDGGGRGGGGGGGCGSGGGSGGGGSGTGGGGGG